MPRCKNIPHDEKSCYYKGDEHTPRGNGWCAKFEEGKTRKGTDGKMYVSKDGRWVKKTSKRKTSPRMELGRYGKRLILYNSIKDNLNIKEMDYDQDDLEKYVYPLSDEQLNLMNIMIRSLDGSYSLSEISNTAKQAHPEPAPLIY